MLLILRYNYKNTGKTLKWSKSQLSQYSVYKMSIDDKTSNQRVFQKKYQKIAKTVKNP